MKIQIKTELSPQNIIEMITEMDFEDAEEFLKELVNEAKFKGYLHPENEK